MAVRLLAGPFPLVDENGDPPSGMSGWIWHPSLGIASDNYSLGGKCVISLDGVVQVVSNWTSTNALGWWLPRQRLLYKGLGPEYVYDARMITSMEAPDDPAGTFAYQYVRLEDRRVYFTARWIYGRAPEETTGTRESEDLGIFGGLVGPGRSDRDIFVAGSNNEGTVSACCFYDVISKERSSEIYYLGGVADNYRVAYAPEWGVFVSYHSSPAPCIRIWSLEVQPDALTLPVVALGEVKAGHVVTYQTRAVGDQQEPCVDELINWTLSGVGRLLSLQSKTDEDGYATVKVRYGLSDTGDSTITASLLC